jgi:hypothetical protein
MFFVVLSDLMQFPSRGPISDTVLSAPGQTMAPRQAGGLEHGAIGQIQW